MTTKSPPRKRKKAPSPMTYFGPLASGKLMPPPILWWIRCSAHGRVEEFCTDCKRVRV